MQALPITSLIAGVLAIVYVLMALNVIRKRAEQGVTIGDSQNDTLKRAIRVHGNFAEYVPYFLILSALNELAGVRPELLYVLAFIMVYGRVAHAYGLLVFEPSISSTNSTRFRQTGMMATLAAISLSAILLLLNTI